MELNDIGFDIENKDVRQAREVTIKCNGKRFRLFLEVVTSCFGNCSGCSLSYSDRRSLVPNLELTKIKEILDYFVPIVNEKKDIRTTVLNLGTGDYFLMPNEFLDGLFIHVYDFFEQLNTLRNVITISSSLFLSEEKMLSKIEIFKKYLHPSQIALDGVVDPFLLDAHYDRYVANYKALKKHFPFFDLVLNVSNGVNKEHIRSLTKFLTEMEILNFDVQYAINKTNTYRVKVSKDKFGDIMSELYDILGDKGKEIFELSIAIPTQDDSGSVFDEMEKQAANIINERLMVKSNGDIYPIGFGFGDILLDDRFNFEPVGNISTKFDAVKAKKMVFANLKRLFLKNKHCHNCEFNKKCYGTGYAFYNEFTEGGECDNVGRVLFERASK